MNNNNTFCTTFYADICFLRFCRRDSFFSTTDIDRGKSDAFPRSQTVRSYISGTIIDPKLLVF